jgi:hypothetical protein
MDTFLLKEEKSSFLCLREKKTPRGHDFSLDIHIAADRPDPQVWAPPGLYARA